MVTPLRVAIALLLCAACAGSGNDTVARVDSASAQAGAAGVPPETRGTILIVGTSLTAGYGLEPSQTYPALLQQKIDSAGLRYEVRNAGVSGETSAGALSRISWLLSDTAEVIVIETGANDALRGVDPDSTRRNIESIILEIRRRNPAVQILLVGMEAPPNLGADFTGRFRRIFPELAAKHGVGLVPFLLAGVALEPDLNQPDGIHPNARGAAVVSENVWQVLRGMLIAR